MSVLRNVADVHQPPKGYFLKLALVTREPSKAISTQKRLFARAYCIKSLVTSICSACRLSAPTRISHRSRHQTVYSDTLAWYQQKIYKGYFPTHYCDLTRFIDEGAVAAEDVPAPVTTSANLAIGNLLDSTCSSRRFGGCRSQDYLSRCASIAAENIACIEAREHATVIYQQCYLKHSACWGL